MNRRSSWDGRAHQGLPEALFSLAAIFALAGLGVSQELPAGAEKETLDTICTVCHTAERIVRSSRTPEEWKEVVLRMIQNGAVLQADQIDPVVEYLAKNFPPPPEALGPAPRLPDGKPNLAGTWMPRRGGRRRHPGIELTDWGKEKEIWNSEPGVILGYEMQGQRERIDLDPVYHCYPPGLVRLGPPDDTVDFGISGAIQIIQTIPGMLLIIYEHRNSVRYIYTDGRAHPRILEATWNGHSIGRWDGDTLVVDTIGLRDESWLDSDGHEHSTQLRVVERFRRLDAGTLEIERTLTDPIALAKPYTSRTVLRLNPRYDLNENGANNDCTQYMLRKPAFGEGMGGLLGIGDHP